MVSAQDEFVQATPANAAELDYIWVSRPTLWALPFQGSRFDHVSAVENDGPAEPGGEVRRGKLSEYGRVWQSLSEYGVGLARQHPGGVRRI